jgi:predicted ATPase/DNA-binding SARP family transcriptional activator/tetratricopeptide (TPR) repeat protein
LYVWFMMSVLKLTLFGAPRIWKQDVGIEIDRKKALALFIYLCLHEHSFSRESLCSLFWSEHNHTQSLAYLRRAIWEINQALGTEWLDTPKNLVGIAPSARQNIWIDVSHFLALLKSAKQTVGDWHTCIALLQQAERLYSADFLAGFGLRDASAFDDWMMNQDSSLRQARLQVYQLLWQGYAETHQWQLALDTAQNWVNIDNLHEPAQQALLESFVATRQLNRAIQAYSHYTSLLWGQLRILPSEAMQAYLRGLKTQKPIKPAYPTPLGSSLQSLDLLRFNYGTPFLGRRNELEELSQLLANPSVHYVCIVGLGGVGKTRLLLESARMQQHLFPHGVDFIPLAAVSHPDHLVNAMCSALQVQIPAEQSDSAESFDHLVEFLKPRTQLLLLDNLEHLLYPSEFAQKTKKIIQDLLWQAPNLKILATSRHAMQISQEWVFPLLGMTQPEVHSPEWEQYGAVQVFVQNARKASAKFHLQLADRPAIAQICQLLDGLPLGLELAAQWANQLTCAEIARQIATNLDFLQTSEGGKAERHRSLKATFNYSWQMLSPQEQSTLAQLAVFRGGFEREPALSVCQSELTTLNNLFGKSLLVRREGRRLDLPQALHGFVLQKLESTPELQHAAQLRHCQYFADFSHGQIHALRSRTSHQALLAIWQDFENIRAGWQFAVTHLLGQALRAYLPVLFHYLDIRNYFQEAVTLFQPPSHLWQASGQSATPPGQSALALLSACQAWFLSRLGRIAVAYPLFHDSLATLQRLEEESDLRFVQTLALNVLPLVSTEKREIALALLAYYRTHQDYWGMAQILPHLGYTLRAADPPQAFSVYNESLQLFQSTGDATSMAEAYLSRAEVLHYNGQYHAAREYHTAALAIAREIHDERLTALCLDYLGYLAREVGEYDSAEQAHQESLRLSQQVGDQLGVAGSLDNLGLLAYERGQLGLALAYFQQGLGLRRATGHAGASALSLEHLAMVFAAKQDWLAAESAAAESELLYQKDPDWAEVSRLVLVQGDILRIKGAGEFAFRVYQTALTIAKQNRNNPLINEILLRFAWLAEAMNQRAIACPLLGWVAQQATADFHTRQLAQQSLVQLQCDASNLLPKDWSGALNLVWALEQVLA